MQGLVLRKPEKGKQTERGGTSDWKAVCWSERQTETGKEEENGG
jgi:hypothetical protein